MSRSALPIMILLSASSGLAAPPATPRFFVRDAFPYMRFQQPLDLRVPRAKGDRVYVVEKSGRIYHFAGDREVRQAKVFLDLRDKVKSDSYEEGLLGLAFHPRFARNRRFFVYYSADGPRRAVVSELKVRKGSTPPFADPKSERVLLEIPQPYANHNGGAMQFGPDGFLYLGVGDGGSAGDPHGNGQNTKTLLGKILRIDVDKLSKKQAYAIPADNPFASAPDKGAPEVYAWGMRNPWRIAFDPLTGLLWAADVGQNAWEEIDVIERGGNYGWNVMEATHCFKPESGCAREGLKLPVAEYGREDGGSVTGGYVYRGSRLPALRGHYIYADFLSGRIWALKVEPLGKNAPVLLADTDLNISSFGLGFGGELYLTAFDGRIYELFENKPGP